MNIVSIVGQKGGSGKSTVASNLAAGLHRAGKSVVIIDADPQATLLDWQAARPEGANLPLVIKATTAKDVQNAIKTAKADVVLIDTPGRAANLSEAVIGLSDISLIVIQPSAPDIWAAAETCNQVLAAKKAGRSLTAAFLVNRIQPNTRMAAEFAKGDWNDFEGIEVMEATIGNRTAFAVAFADGVTVYETAGAEAARAEIDLVIQELEAAQWLA